MRRTKRDWLMEGVHVLTESGATHLTIETLTQRLGVTKGSFYHHFASHPEFIAQLLLFYEQEGTLQVMAETDTEATPMGKLQRLLEITIEEPRHIEIAFRAWALQDPQAREVQTRIDQERVDYLRVLCGALLNDPLQAHHMASLLYLTYVGAQLFFPPLDAEVVRALYGEITQHYLRSE